MNISRHAAGPRVAEDDFITSLASSDLAGASKTPESGGRRGENWLTSGQRCPAVRGEAACACVLGAEVLEGGDLQGGAICTKAVVPDYYGEQVATEDEARKRWRGRMADGISEEEQQTVMCRNRSLKDALLLILSGTLDRGCDFHAAI